MKINNFSLGLTLVFILSVTFYISCTKQEALIDDSQKLFLKDYDIIGKQHNEGLAYVYSDLKELVKSERKTIDKIDPEELRNSIDKSVARFNSTINNSENAAIGDIIYKNIMPKQKAFYSNLTKSSGETTFFDSVIVSLNLTAKQRDILQCLSEIFKIETDSINKVRDQLKLLVLRVDNEISTNEESAILYCALSIGIYSYEYWIENLEKWRLLSSEPLQKKWFNCQDVVNDDMAAGISGGLVGALVGGTASMGTLTVPAWVAGAAVGAVGGSSCNALKQVFNHFWGDGTN
jgi:hypothetical protein